MFHAIGPAKRLRHSLEVVSSHLETLQKLTNESRERELRSLEWRINVRNPRFTLDSRDLEDMMHDCWRYDMEEVSGAPTFAHISLLLAVNAPIAGYSSVLWSYIYWNWLWRRNEYCQRNENNQTLQEMLAISKRRTVPN